MKKKLLFVLLVIVLIMSCKSTSTGANADASAGSNISNFSDILGKEWKLIEVQIDGASAEKIALDKDNIGKIYTMSFNEEMVSGVGAPNRYSAPYTAGDKNSLKINMMRSTQMAPINQPDKLQEFTFYNYMQSVEKWSFDGGKLVLHSKTDDGNAVKLIFVQ